MKRPMTLQGPSVREVTSRTKKRSWRRAALGACFVLLALGVAAALSEYRSVMRPPTQRLGLGQHYRVMPPDERHHYLRLPLDHRDPGAGEFTAFYLLSPGFRRGTPVVFFLTDGQMQLVGLQPDFRFFDQVLGGGSYVLIGHRGHAPTLFPEVYDSRGALDYSRAMNLYGSAQQVDDIEAVRLDMQRQGYLPPDGRIDVFGASGAGVLAQQYLARHGQHVRRALLAVTGAPDLAAQHGWPYSPDFVAFHPEAARRLESLSERRALDLPSVANILYQTGRAG